MRALCLSETQSFSINTNVFEKDSIVRCTEEERFVGIPVLRGPRGPGQTPPLSSGTSPRKEEGRGEGQRGCHGAKSSRQDPYLDPGI